MKNIKMLPIDSEIIDKIKQTDANYRRFLSVGCDILAVENEVITVRVAQFQRLTDNVFTDKELIEKAKEVFSHLPDGKYKLRFRALTWKGEGIDLVGPDWVRNQAKKYHIKQNELAISMNVDEQHMSKLLSGQFAFTNAWKAAFYYYFQNLSHASSSQKED